MIRFVTVSRPIVFLIIVLRSRFEIFDMKFQNGFLILLTLRSCRNQLAYEVPYRNTDVQ